MIKKKLLLSGLGGSLFPYLHNKLMDKYDLYYVDADTQLKLLYPDYNFYPAQYVTDPAYYPFIDKIVTENNIDFYAPLIDEEILGAKEYFKNHSHLIVIAPEASFCTLCLDKYTLMGVLKEKGISTIASFTGDNYDDNIPYPIFLKPNTGRGSRGIRKVENLEQLNAYYLLEGYAPKDILIQEYVAGTEYTVGVSTNNNNDLLFISSKKVLRKRGITQLAVTENNELINEVVKKIVAELNPCGPFNVQLYLTKEGEVKIFEINPRFSTTTIMSYEAGVDEIGLFIDNYNKHLHNVEIVYPKPGIILHRRWENCFYEQE
jgi:carbamoyl-phosphate synthase large subunit